MRPSRISTLRAMRSAIAWSWVITTIVEPARWSWSISARMDVAGRLVEVAGRLVGQHDRGLADQRPGDRDALALPARELGRTGVWTPGQADQLQRGEGALAALPEGDAGVEEPVGDVIEHAWSARPGRTAGR